MKRINSVIEGSKLWLLIKDLMNMINSGKKSVQEVYRKPNHELNCHKVQLRILASAHSIR
jgi:hypothetical protein